MTHRYRLSLGLFLFVGFLGSWNPWFQHLWIDPGINPNPAPLWLLIAAVIACAVLGGWRAVKVLLVRLVRFRVVPSLWLFALLAPPAIMGLTVGLSIAAGGEVEIRFDGIAELLPPFGFFLLFCLGEEAGWRGYLLPKLQEKMSPLQAAAIVSAIWALWHLPMFGGDFPWPVVPMFLLSVPPGAIALAWLYNASGSIALPLIMHALINLSAGVAFHPAEGFSTRLMWWMLVAVWWTLAAAVIVATKARLGTEPELN